MKRISILAIGIFATLALTVGVTAALGGPPKPPPPNPPVSTVTTLDACGYFAGVQTPRGKVTDKTHDGVTSHREKGTWTGVFNYGPPYPTDITLLGSPTYPLVVSLGPVKGHYDESYTRDAAGDLNGTESFRSKAGTIFQTFAFDTTTGYHVSVVATKDLAFLTSNTEGNCYTGTFPRP